MATATLISLYLVFVGVAGYLLILGSKSALFGFGYWLIGGRESFGWGAKLAGGILMVPLPASIAFWIIAVSTGYLSLPELFQGRQTWIGPMLFTGLSSLGAVVASYLLAEATNTPYWVYNREEKPEEDEKEEDLPRDAQARRRQKIERKLEKARRREEERLRLLEEEQELLKRRHEQAKKRKPPPLPSEREDYDEEDDYQDPRWRK